MSKKTVLFSFVLVLVELYNLNDILKQDNVINVIKIWFMNDYIVNEIVNVEFMCLRYIRFFYWGPWINELYNHILMFCKI